MMNVHLKHNYFRLPFMPIALKMILSSSVGSVGFVQNAAILVVFVELELADSTLKLK